MVQPYKKPIQELLRCFAQELDRWEERLEELFAGRPYDIYDAALTATISDFPVSIQPFRDMVGCCLSHLFICSCGAKQSNLPPQSLTILTPSGTPRAGCTCRELPEY